jgi:antitoxin component YwqK of YwqJK toxin-antitoxin module
VEFEMTRKQNRSWNWNRNRKRLWNKNASRFLVFCLPVIRVLVLFFPGLPALCAGEEAWYRSNSIGALLESIDTPGVPDAADFEYVLHIYREDEKETRTLFDKERQEVRRQERLYSYSGPLEEETVFVEGVQDSRSLYYPSGLVKEEVLFTNGREDGRFHFTYPAQRDFPAGLLEERGASVPTGDSTGDYKKLAPLSVSFSRPDATGFHDEYQYLPSGDFRGIKRIYDDGAVYTSIFSLDNGILRDEWHSFSGFEIFFHYDKRGNALYTEEYRDSVLVERGDFRYDTQSPFRLRERRTRDPASGRETILEYGEDGNPSRESILEGGVYLEITLFTYTNNLLVRRETRWRTDYEEWQYVYNDDKDLISEYYFRGGKMSMTRTHWPEAGGGEEYSSLEEYFRDGNVFLRVYFKDGEEVKREIPGEESQ